MKVLIINDDGIASKGLDVLYNIVSEISTDIWVVAPNSERSGSSHSFSINRSVDFFKVGDRRYIVNGTPVDCTIFAMTKIFINEKPDFIISGINIGYNLGEDVFYSGTIGAAKEGSLFGVPSIALSQAYEEGGEVDWDIAKKYGADLLRKLMKFIQPYSCISANFPFANSALDVKGFKVVPHGISSSRSVARVQKNLLGQEEYWLVGKYKNKNSFSAVNYSDIDALRDKYIAITPLNLQVTHFDYLEKIKKMF